MLSGSSCKHMKHCRTRSKQYKYECFLHKNDFSLRLIGAIITENTKCLKKHKSVANILLHGCNPYLEYQGTFNK